MQETTDSSRLPALPNWIPEPVAGTWASLERFPLISAGIVVVLGLLAAKLAGVVLRRGLVRVTARTKTNLDDAILARLERPIFISVFFFALTVAVRVLLLPPTFGVVVTRSLQTIVVLVWLFASLPILRLVLDALGRHHERFPLIEERTIPLFDMIGKILLVGGASWSLLMVWHLDPTPWLASASVLGFAVGFAAKDTLANLFSGFFIVADRPYQIGDFIVLESGERGRVTQVGIRSTRLLTRDDIEITLPNAQIANAKIVNESGGPWEKERIRIRVGVAYGSDVDQVCAVLEDIALAHEGVCDHPRPRIRMRGFGASSLDFELLCWIDEPVLRGRTSHHLYMTIYKRFAAEGIEIPFEQRDVHVRSWSVPPRAAGSTATND